jgi:selenide,water dikinase
VLDKALKGVKFPTNQHVLVDASFLDDAGIFQIDDNIALVQTTDFFTPIVNDPYLYGQIAAANALSDIYAMGAEPITALNVLCYPDGVLEADALRLILQGGADKAKEAGVVVLGGHSVSDKELKYGMAVTGKIHPDKIKLNHNLNIGDILLLTKSIGTGILTTALKNDVVTEDELNQVIESMLTLNREPAKLLQKYPVSACTDITGYGLLGHLWEMVAKSEYAVQLKVNKISFFEKAISFAQEISQIPGGTLANQQFVQNHVVMGRIDVWYQNLLFDPQTSGGLLIGIPPQFVSDFIDDLKDYTLPVSVVGEVIKGENKIYLE